MSLAAVIRALHGAGIQPTGREIAEALWLAQHMAGPSASAAKAQPQQPAPDENDDQTGEPAPASPPSFPEPVPLSTANFSVEGSRVRGHPVGIPDLPGLQRREDIQRALRPLRRYGPSPRRRVIDEDATATFVANTGVWTPVMRPAPERWFDVVLAIDSSPSMDLWRPLISDLRAVLVATGAFRDVRTWRLRPQQQAMILPPGSHPGAAARSPRELIDGSGRRLFFVVTDGAARGWHDGSATGALTDWSKTGPVAVLQPLPEEMWARTGLPAVPVRLSASAPGTRNNQLRVDYYRRRRRFSGIPIPVLGIEPNALYSWARLVTGSASAVPLAATSAGGDRPTLSPLTGENEPGNAIDGFRASASPQAYQLAVFLSAVPLTLPIMRLVQHVAIPASSTSALAEVILGGLISRTGDNTYEFLPGIRDALLSELRRSEMATVLSAVSDYIAQHAGTASQTFAAIAQRADGPVTADAEAFSWVPSAVAARLGLPDVSRQRYGDQSLDQTIPSSDTGMVFAGDVHVARPVVRSAYLELVKGLAPVQLLDREGELAELAAFCTQPDGNSYVWWRGPAWAGKSALMSWFVLHPPAGVQVVSFFVAARFGPQSDRAAAFIEAMLEQLAEVAGQPMPHELTESDKQAWFGQLLHDAAVACEARKQRLVLVVDGLDEDQGVTGGPDAESIAALLPARPPAGLRVIVTGRPSPAVPVNVPDHHPLRDPGIMRMLTVSPSAQISSFVIRDEVKWLLRGDPLRRDMLGLVAAADGGLSAGDLAELTGMPVYAIEENLRAAAGRTFAAHASAWRPNAAPPVYALAHGALQEVAAAYLGEATLAAYREQLYAWAEGYRQRGWPAETPEYLLTGYFWLLATLGDLPRMLDLTLDSARQDRMLDVTGNDEAALAEFAAIQEAIGRQPEPNPIALARLTLFLDTIERRNASIPTALPAIWASLGETDRAESLVRSIIDPDRQAEASALIDRLSAAGAEDTFVAPDQVADSGDEILQEEQAGQDDKPTFAAAFPRRPRDMASANPGMSGSYQAAISQKYPACILFLLDQSASMREPFAGEGTARKANAMADAINNLLMDLVIRCTQNYGEGPRNYVDVGVIGYGSAAGVGSCFGGALKGREIVSIKDLAVNPLRVEERTRQAADGAGGQVSTTVRFPVWFDPVAESGTPMAEAMQVGRKILEPWVAAHPKSYPPIVINITDGEPNSDPTRAARELVSLRSDDGNVLLYNIYLSSRPLAPIAFPSTEARLPDKYARLLFGMSSVVPPQILSELEAEGYSVDEDARGFAFNADSGAFIRFLDFGTRLALPE